jgi:hypothetical protein
MQNLKYIKSFTFDKAQYEVSDGNGGRATLKINYRKNIFEIDEKSSLSSLFINELKAIAHDLLKRKHGVNFAEKVRV